MHNPKDIHKSSGQYSLTLRWETKLMQHQNTTLVPSNLICKVVRDLSGVLVLLFNIQNVQPQVQLNVQYFFRQVVGNKIEATLKRYLSS